MYYTTTTTADKNLPPLPREGEFDKEALILRVCELFGVTKRGICDHKKDEKCRWARWVIWKFCMELTRMNYRQGAEIFPECVDHRSTVIHAEEKLPEDLVQFEWLKEIVDTVYREFTPKTEKI